MDSPSPGAPVVCRFTTLDAMILVAATAAGLAGIPSEVRIHGWPDLLKMMDTPSGGNVGETLTDASLVAIPALGAWSLALVALRLRRPRPARRRPARQPGVVVGASLGLGWAAGGLMTLCHQLSHSRSGWVEPLSVLYTTSALFVGLAVVVGWTTLAMVGRWRPEPAWPDRLGRALGVAWVVLGSLSGWVIVWNAL